MAKRKRLIPFGALPAAWGLSGKSRALAEAEYYFDGEELERKRVEINIAEKTEKEVEVALLEIDKEYGKISEADYTRKKAVINNEAFIRVAKIETDPKNPAFGGIIFDYNEAFVLYLEEHGYGPNPDPDDTINEWFNELCKNIALDAFDGLGDFTERMNEAAERKRSTMSEDVILTGDK